MNWGSVSHGALSRLRLWPSIAFLSDIFAQSRQKHMKNAAPVGFVLQPLPRSARRKGSCSTALLCCHILELSLFLLWGATFQRLLNEMELQGGVFVEKFLWFCGRSVAPAATPCERVQHSKQRSLFAKP